jgi:hypothetical protein
MPNTSRPDKMTTKTRSDPDALTAHLRRMSVVFAVELRLKIVAELYMREMSPTRFYEEFGGGSISRVTRNFERLAEAGWLEYIRKEGPGGRRRGGIEHFYRATELAYFDAETWALLPYSIRVAFSWNSFKQIAARLRTAVEAGWVEPGSKGRFTSESVSLDRVGWANVVDAVRVHFEFIFEEQRAAGRRIARSGEEPIRASVVQIAFEPPAGGGCAVGPHLVEGGEEPVVPLPVRLSKAFADDVCMRILHEANSRDISATQFHAEVGCDSVAAIRRRFKKLAKFSLLTEVDARTGGRRRGATEKFYRATGPAIFAAQNGPWMDMPESVRDTATWLRFEGLSAQIKEAMQEGSFDAREDSCLAWSLLELDRQGWEAVTVDLDALRRFASEEQERAAVRMGETGESPVEMAVALAAFESSKESEREP